MSHRPSLLVRLRCLVLRRPLPPPEVWRARKLIAAIDAGGVPLNPALINRIARDLGLEVSVRAVPEETIERIRAALTRV